METKTLFSQRRSVNYFDKQKTISDTLLKEIIDTAVLAPSGFNLQPWRIIAVKSDENKQNLYELANKQVKIMEAPVTLIVIGDKEGYGESNPVWKEMLQSVGGKQEIVDRSISAAAFLYGSSEERKIKFAESNAGLLAMALMISAKDFGIDSHAMSGIDFEGIHQKFGLKRSETVVMLICLGSYDPKQPLYPRRPRRLFNEIASIV